MTNGTAKSILNIALKPYKLCVPLSLASLIAGGMAASAASITDFIRLEAWKPQPSIVYPS